MRPEQLKLSILQYAIQGKLVEQRPEEGTAEELYHQIQEEKQNLIREGKIKKEKPLPDITDDEIPFDIPESWRWVRLSTVGITQTGNTPKKAHPEYFGNYIPFLGPGDIQNNLVNYDNQGLTEIGKSYGRVTPAGSVLQVCIGGSIGKCALIDREVTFNQQINSIYPILSDSNYIFYVLDSQYFINFLKENSGGTATPIINRGLWDAIAIPLPPLEEQNRIVAKIEEILPYIDQYAKAYEKLEQFNAKFPEEMKKSILQYAIQGKLVDQRQEEGTAEDLYKQIQDEKQKLIKEGKIKKEKPVADITDEEIPYDIPDSWKWVRLSGAALSIVDCPHSTPKYLANKSEYCAIDTNCIDANGDITGFRYVDSIDYQKRIERLEPQGDDIVYTREGSICRAAILPSGKKICLGQRVMLIRCSDSLNAQYLKRILMAPQTVNTLTAKQKGLGAKHVNVADVCNLVFPLPPIDEQKRIVEKLDELENIRKKLVNKV